MVDQVRHHIPSVKSDRCLKHPGGSVPSTFCLVRVAKALDPGPSLRLISHTTHLLLYHDNGKCYTQMLYEENQVDGFRVLRAVAMYLSGAVPSLSGMVPRVTTLTLAT
jgi:hypothetical protein